MAGDPRVKSPAEQFADTYRAGLLAGLREAAEVVNTSLTRGSAEANIRARIAGLEEEAGRK